MKTHGNNIAFAIISPGFTRILIAILFFFPTIGQSEIYKWVDENGKVHFDDRPGSGKKEKITVKTTEISSGNGTELQERFEQEKKLLDIYEEERQEESLKKAEQREEKKQWDKKCADAKEYQKNIDRSSGLYTLDEKEERVYLSDEERNTKVKELKEFIKKNCN